MTIIIDIKPMKTNQKVIRRGDYYELETIEDLMMQQKIPKKEDPVSASNSQPNDNILTELPSRSAALKNYSFVRISNSRTENYGLDNYQFQLQELLKLPIRDQQRLQIEKLLKQISEIKNSEQLPLNELPVGKKAGLGQQPPQHIEVYSEFNIGKIEKSVKDLQQTKYIQLSRLEHIVQILLDERKQEDKPAENTQIDSKMKQQIESVYNSLSGLTCLQNLTGIVNKIGLNQAKFLEIKNILEKTQEANRVNKETLDQFQNDARLLNQLEQNFKQNIGAVKNIVKKLSQ